MVTDDIRWLAELVKAQALAERQKVGREVVGYGDRGWMQPKMAAEDLKVERCDRLLAALDQRDQAVEALIEQALVPHLDLDEDCYYSCPKAPSQWGDGSASCNDDAVRKGACTCGADSRNEQIAKAIREAWLLHG